MMILILEMDIAIPNDSTCLKEKYYTYNFRVNKQFIIDAREHFSRIVFQDPRKR